MGCACVSGPLKNVDQTIICFLVRERRHGRLNNQICFYLWSPLQATSQVIGWSLERSYP